MEGSHKFWIAVALAVCVQWGICVHQTGSEVQISNYWILMGLVFVIQQILSFIGARNSEWVQYTSIIYWTLTLLKRFNR